jgi:cytochrome c-type biogenesis protein
MDPVGAAFSAAAAQSPWAPAFAFAAGTLTSFGPCVAPRFIAVAALATPPGAQRWKAIASLAAGLCASYVVLGIASGFAARIAALTANVYGILAVALVIYGIVTLVRQSPSDACAHVEEKKRSLGGIFLFGASFALVASPCCTPVVVLLGSLPATRRAPVLGALLVAAFAVGHAVPLALAGFGWQWVGIRTSAGAWRSASQTIGGALMLALGAYYGVLA